MSVYIYLPLVEVTMPHSVSRQSIALNTKTIFLEVLASSDVKRQNYIVAATAHFWRDWVVPPKAFMKLKKFITYIIPCPSVPTTSSRPECFLSVCSFMS